MFHLWNMKHAVVIVIASCPRSMPHSSSTKTKRLWSDSHRFSSAELAETVIKFAEANKVCTAGKMALYSKQWMTFTLPPGPLECRHRCLPEDLPVHLLPGIPTGKQQLGRHCLSCTKSKPAGLLAEARGLFSLQELSSFVSVIAIHVPC
jgi:hypothetical protein